jgi:Family of unknown function (DUF6272)
LVRGQRMNHHPLNIFDFYTRMRDNHILLSFKGEITPDLLSSILQVMELKMEQLKEDTILKKKVFNILVEALQNLYHHLGEIEIPDHIANDDSRAAILMIGKKESAYFLVTGNYIANDKITPLKDRLDKINSMNKEELKAFYKDVLSNEGFSDKGGGGLGMIDIARKSGKKLDYRFEEITTAYSFFSLEISIA